MSDYRKILVAVDLSDDATIVIDKARHIARANNAELSVVHVQEPLIVGYALDVPTIDLAGIHSELATEARKRLLALADSVDVPASRVHNLNGQPAREIRELAKKIDADLIVVGGHGKHGLELIMGSTSTGIAHGVTCDLLIVRLQ